MSTEAGDPRNLPVRRPMNLAPTGTARAHLECIAGPEKGQTFRVAPGVTQIGRDPAGEVVLTEAAISRQHARIERRGEQWVVVNLSANGTRVNKQNVDEAVLADGDVIHVGAKTRLRFAVEQVAVSPTGRPQFRARTTRPEEAEAAQPEAAEERPVSLFQRRKKLFIGLGAYFALIIIGLVVFLALGAGRGGGAAEVPILGLDDAVRRAGGRTYRITRLAPDGIWIEDEFGQPRLVRKEDIESGTYTYIPGMRKALEKRFEAEVNFESAKRDEREALTLYERRLVKPGNLFQSVRCFQRALAAYGGRSYFENPNINNIYRDAVDELLTTIKREYDNAVFYEKSGDYKAAWHTYRQVQDMIPEPDNLIARNVTQRMGLVRAKAGKMK